MATTQSNGELANKLATQGAALKPIGVHHELQKWFGGAQQYLASMCGTPEEARKIFTCSMAAIVRNPKLMECTTDSLQQCIRSTATLRLYPGPLQEVAFVPRKNGKTGLTEANFEVQYQGLVKLAVQGGHVKDISAEVVYEADKFDYDLGTNQFLTHKKNLRGDCGLPIAAYAIARLPGGDSKVCIMSVDEIEKVRNTSRAKDDGPWRDHWDEMAKKTVIKRLAKTVTKSTNDQRFAEAIEVDNASERPDLVRTVQPIVDVESVTPSDDATPTTHNE